MNKSILSVHKYQTLGFKQAVPPFISNAARLSPKTEFLSISYSPQVKLMCAHWSENVNSQEFRQSVRLLVRSAALLRVERILLDMPVCPFITDDDQRWISNFLREVMDRGPIRRVARVMPPDSAASEVMHQVLSAAGNLPYELQLFEDPEKAEKWLLEGLHENMTKEERIRIPLHINLKLARSKFMQRGMATVQVSAPQGGYQASMPEPLPDQVQVHTEFVSLSIDKGKSLMSIRWKKAPKSRQYRYGILKAARAVKEYRLERLLLNNQRLGVLTLEDQAWLIATAERLIPETNLNKLAVVTSADALQQMSSETIGRKLKEANLKHSTKNFLAEEEAIDWLLSDTELL